MSLKLTLIFATYSDGHDEDFKSSTSSDQSREDAAVQYLSATRRRGRETLTELIEDNRRQNRRFTCVVYTIFLTSLGWLNWRALIQQVGSIWSARRLDLRVLLPVDRVHWDPNKTEDYMTEEPVPILKSMLWLQTLLYKYLIITRPSTLTLVACNRFFFVPFSCCSFLLRKDS
uniref:Uncharacterized protein n=1 Tax=Brassica oleracea var. oleracea TaxID=109376 RepID=A0A0D3DLZ8_BRAOL